MAGVICGAGETGRSRSSFTKSKILGRALVLRDQERSRDPYWSTRLLAGPEDPDVDPRKYSIRFPSSSSEEGSRLLRRRSEPFGVTSKKSRKCVLVKKKF